jgi:DNA-binding transcriptional regulator YiaG
MRGKRIAILGALGISVGLMGPLVRATVSLDLTDFNDDVMREMDDTMKRLDSDIATRDATSVATDARSIRDGLKWAQDYFAKKANVEDAVKWAKQGQDLADAVARSAQSSDFDTSLSTYDSLIKTCRACHDAYKPPDI